jgi:soluble lytic murein transglycosylase-like protein
VQRTCSFALLLLAFALISGSRGAVQPRSAPAPPPPVEVLVPGSAAPDSLQLQVAIAERLASRQTGLEPGEITRLAQAVVSEARARDFDPWLVLAVIEVESTFDNFAVSPVGALGLMQILPSTGEALARRLGIPWRGTQTLFDPVLNVKLGVAYLHELHERFGHLPTALAAYNWGPGRIGRWVRNGSALPVHYAQRVLSTRELRTLGTVGAS